MLASTCRPGLLVLGLSLALVVPPTAGCAADTSQLSGGVAAVDDWVNNPGDIKDALAQVGVAKIGGSVSSARNRAEVDGRAKIAATAKSQVQSLMSTWFKEAGDTLDESTLSSYMNDEGLIRQVTDVEIIGARPVKYEVRDGYQYVLVVLDDPAKWAHRVGSSVKDRVLKDETLFKTEVMKQDFEAKLDALVNRDAAALAAERESMNQKYDVDD